jgi:hypothetical protein
MRFLYALPIVLLPNTAHFPPDMALGLSIAALAVAALLGDRDPAHLARPGYLMPPLVALGLAMALGFFAAHWHDTSGFEEDLREAKSAVLFPLLYLAYRRSGLDEKAVRQLLGLLLVVAVAAGMEAVLQGLSFELGAFSETQRATGPFGPLKMANRAGVFFAMFLPVLVALALQPRQSRHVRWASLAGAAVLATAILFTYSRQAYLIGLFAVMVVLLWRSVPAAVLAAVLLAATAFSVLPGSVVERIQETQQVDATGEVALDASTTSRFTIWLGTLDMVRDHPGGVGLGRFNEHIGRYTSYAGKDAHNGFVLTLAECGPLGLLALLWVFWRLWRLARWLRRSAAERRDARALELGFTMAVVSLALGNLYGSPYFDNLITSNFWILCGLMERYGTMRAHEAAVAAYEHRRPGSTPLPFGKRFPLFARALPGSSGDREALR